MTKPAHTPEPWGYVENLSGSENHKGFRLHGASNWYFAEVYPVDEDGTEGRANARRIVACVNACKGIPTEKLESGDYRMILQNKKPRPLKPRYPDGVFDDE